MRAVTWNEHGAQPALRDNLPTPTPGAGEVLVRVHASSVNPVDNGIAASMAKDMVPHELPVTLGRDFAGVVEQVGDGVTGVSAGDAVFGFVPAMGPTVRDRLKGHHVEAHPDRRLSISSQVIRAEVEGDVVVAVGGGDDAGVQIAGLLDALHFWLIRRGRRGPLRYVVGSRESAKETRGVLQALARLTEASAGEVDVRIELDFEPVALEAPDFASCLQAQVPCGRLRNIVWDVWSSSAAGARRTGTRALASGWPEVLVGWQVFVPGARAPTRGRSPSSGASSAGSRSTVRAYSRAGQLYERPPERPQSQARGVWKPALVRPEPTIRVMQPMPRRLAASTDNTTGRG